MGKLNKIIKGAAVVLLATNSTVTSLSNVNVHAQVPDTKLLLKNQKTITIPSFAKLNSQKIETLDQAIEFLKNQGIVVNKDQVVGFLAPNQSGEVKYIGASEQLPSGYHEVPNGLEEKRVESQDNSLSSSGWIFVGVNKLPSINFSSHLTIPFGASVNGKELSTRQDVVDYINHEYNLNLDISDLGPVVFPKVVSSTQSYTQKNGESEASILAKGYFKTPLKDNSSWISNENGNVIMATGPFAPLAGETKTEYVNRMAANHFEVMSYSPEKTDHFLQIGNNPLQTSRQGILEQLQTLAHKVTLSTDIAQEINSMKLNVGNTNIAINSWNELFSEARTHKFSFDTDVDIFTRQPKQHIYQTYLLGYYLKNGLISNDVVQDQVLKNDATTLFDQKFIDKFGGEKLESELTVNRPYLDHSSGIDLEKMNAYINLYNGLVKSLNNVIIEKKVSTLKPFNMAKISVVANNQETTFDNIKDANDKLKEMATNVKNYVVKTRLGNVVEAFASNAEATNYISSLQSLQSNQHQFILSGNFEDKSVVKFNTLFGKLNSENAHYLYNQIMSNPVDANGNHYVYFYNGKPFTSLSDVNDAVLKSASAGVQLFSKSGQEITPAGQSQDQIDKQIDSFISHDSVTTNGQSSSYYQVVDSSNKLGLTSSQLLTKFNTKQEAVDFIKANTQVKLSNGNTYQSYGVNNLQIDDISDKNNLVVEQWDKLPELRVEYSGLEKLISDVANAVDKPLIAKNGSLTLGNADETKLFFASHSDLFTSITNSNTNQETSYYTFGHSNGKTIEDLLLNLEKNNEVKPVGLHTFASASIRMQIHPTIFNKIVKTNIDGSCEYEIPHFEYLYSRRKVESNGSDGFIKINYVTPKLLPSLAPSPLDVVIPPLVVQKVPYLVPSLVSNLVPSPMETKVPTIVMPAIPHIAGLTNTAAPTRINVEIVPTEVVTPDVLPEVKVPEQTLTTFEGETIVVEGEVQQPEVDKSYQGIPVDLSGKPAQLVFKPTDISSLFVAPTQTKQVPAVEVKPDAQIVVGVDSKPAQLVFKETDVTNLFVDPTYTKPEEYLPIVEQPQHVTTPAEQKPVAQGEVLVSEVNTKQPVEVDSTKLHVNSNSEIFVAPNVPAKQTGNIISISEKLPEVDTKQVINIVKEVAKSLLNENNVIEKNTVKVNPSGYQHKDPSQLVNESKENENNNDQKVFSGLKQVNLNPTLKAEVVKQPQKVEKSQVIVSKDEIKKSKLLAKSSGKGFESQSYYSDDVKKSSNAMFSKYDMVNESDKMNWSLDSIFATLFVGVIAFLIKKYK